MITKFIFFTVGGGWFIFAWLGERHNWWRMGNRRR